MCYIEPAAAPPSPPTPSAPDPVARATATAPHDAVLGGKSPRRPEHFCSTSPADVCPGPQRDSCDVASVAAGDCGHLVWPQTPRDYQLPTYMARSHGG
jgi:hypothetical protein